MADIIFEIKRKLFHITSLIYIPLYYYIAKYFNHQIALLSLLAILLIFLIIEYFRLKHQRQIPFFQVLFREKEKDKLAGAVFFALSAVIVFALFDFRIAVTALLMTTFGDMAAAIFGITIGKHWINKDVAWEGVIAEFVVDLVIAILILQNIWIALAMALVATYVETEFIQADDNLVIPVFAGFVAQVLSMVL